MSRSVWTGNLNVGLVHVPVAAYKATEHAKGTNKRWLHAECLTPVNLEKVCHKCDKANITMDDIVDGVQQDDGSFVVISDEDLKIIKAPTTDTIIIESVVPENEIDPIYVDSTYYLGPGKKPTPGYVLLREAMKAKSVVMVGRLSIYGRENLVAVKPFKKILVLQLLRTTNEVRAAEATPYFGVLETIDARQLVLANQLLTLYAGTFDPTTNEDRYVTAFQAMVAAKKNGEERPPIVASATPEFDLMTALTKSLEAKAPKAPKTPKTGSPSKKKKEIAIA